MPLRIRPASGGDAGFTLVEALVSLFVFSLIASGCVAMLMQSVSSQRRVGEAHEALRELQTARALLSADLLQIAPRATRDPGGARRSVFVGGVGPTVSFVRAAAEPDPVRKVVGRLSAVSYVIEDDRLVRRSRDALDPLDGAVSAERVIFRALKDARFEFFDGMTWRTEWRAEGASAALPRAVALVGETPRYGRVRIEALLEPAS